MKSIGEQFTNIITSRADFSDVSVGGAELIAEEMKKNTDGGKGFGADEYINDYEPSYAKRKKQGQLSPVTLRGSQRRIEQTEVRKISNVSNRSSGASIQFVDPEGGRILNYHHKGTAKGGKTRSIFPKAVESIPIEIKSKFAELVREALAP